jgi:peptidase M28-like protein
MLDPRIYRVGLVPVVLAIVVVAFSLGERPRPIRTTLAPDSFSATRANTGLGDLGGLRRLVKDFPDRRPGGHDDDALAARVASLLRRDRFKVHIRRFAGETVDGSRELQTVIADRPGRSNRRIVVLAHRDAAHEGAAAELSGTAALLELGRVFRERVTNRTLTLVSTSGGSGGAAGAADFARHTGGPVDAILVLGDLGGTSLRKPYVVPWSNGLGAAPLDLRRTVEAALATEISGSPGGTRSVSQFARFAIPATTGEQGELLRRGLPAVLIQASGERGPKASDEVDPDELQAFGRGALRAINALDNGPDVGTKAEAEIVIQRKVLPGWAVRLLVGTLLLGPAFAVIDGFARARRRREPVVRWLGWVAAGALPFIATALFAALLGITGILSAAPPGPTPPSALPVDGAAVAALASTALVLALGWLILRPFVLRRLRLPSRPNAPGAGAAVMLTLVALGIVVWVFNPYTAALLVPAIHLWLLVAAPEVRVPRPLGITITVLGLAPVILVAVAYAFALGVGPVALLWGVLLAVAGGHLGPLAAIAWSLVLACSAAVFAMFIRPRPPGPARDVTVRGPLGYAGPGSLGGTESALRGR